MVPEKNEVCRLRGKALKYGDNVDTDVIIPARYLNTSDPKELAKHAMEDIDPKFISKISKGDFVVAGRNFGCGSSREHAPIALKHAGVGAVVAKSFARIFYRNAINIALPLVECDTSKISEGDALEIDLLGGKIKNITGMETCSFVPMPEFVTGIFRAGGLVNYTKRRLKG